MHKVAVPVSHTSQRLLSALRHPHPLSLTLPINSHSLDLTKDRVEGNEIQADRMTRVDRHGNKQASGSIEVDLRKGDYDELLESAFFNSYATDVLKVGTTPKYFTMEDAANDIAQFRLFTGLAVSTASFSIAPNQMVTATFDMVGKGIDTGWYNRFHWWLPNTIVH